MKPVFRPPESWPRAYNTQDVAFLRKKKICPWTRNQTSVSYGETVPWRYYKAQLVHFISCSLKDFCGATVVLFRCRKFIQWDRSILTRQLVFLPSIVSQSKILPSLRTSLSVLLQLWSCQISTRPSTALTCSYMFMEKTWTYRHETVVIFLVWDTAKGQSFTWSFLHWYILAVFNDKLLFLLYSAKTLKILPFQNERVKGGKKERKKEEKVSQLLRFSRKGKNYPFLLNFIWICYSDASSKPMDFWQVLTSSTSLVPVCSPYVSPL